MTRDHTFVRCEDCRNHGRCKKERTAFRPWHIKGCIVEEKANAIEGTAEKLVGVDRVGGCMENAR